MTITSFMAGDANSLPKKQYGGYTLIELTVVIFIVLLLIGVLFIGSQAYVNGARETTCIINQDTIHTAIVSQANLKKERLVPGIDYFLDPEFQASFGTAPVCPAVGSYTAFVDPTTERLVITCVEHGHAR